MGGCEVGTRAPTSEKCSFTAVAGAAAELLTRGVWRTVGLVVDSASVARVAACNIFSVWFLAVWNLARRGAILCEQKFVWLKKRTLSCLRGAVARRIQPGEQSPTHRHTAKHPQAPTRRPARCWGPRCRPAAPPPCCKPRAVKRNRSQCATSRQAGSAFGEWPCHE